MGKIQIKYSISQRRQGLVQNPQETRMPNKLFRAHPRNYGKDSRRCRVTNNAKGIIRRYGLIMSRRAFRELAPFIGFIKYRQTPPLRDGLSADEERIIVGQHTLTLMIV
eukprot:TRINITY_DN111_c0_g1_i1.p3 TRINITY_DN111_c0_g1~~TRINITY_DN111_c0_g1_i1.p3  ORF type:complete len:109 (-),score=6.58 TRINITY_DN111_c0_g1_i1:214-540(-)